MRAALHGLAVQFRPRGRVLARSQRSGIAVSHGDRSPRKAQGDSGGARGVKLVGQ